MMMPNPQPAAEATRTDVDCHANTGRARRIVLAGPLHAADLLEKEASLGGRLKFRTNELFIRLNDRLLAPNTAETFAAVSRDVKKLTDLLYGSAEAQIEYQPSALTLFETRVKTQDSQSIEAILSRINAK